MLNKVDGKWNQGDSLLLRSLPPQPAQEKKLRPRHCWHVEVEFHESVQRESKERKPDRELQAIRNASAIKQNHRAKDKDREGEKADEAGITRLFEIIVVSELGHFGLRRLEAFV